MAKQEWIKCDSGIVRILHIVRVIERDDDIYQIVDITGATHNIDRAAWVWFTKDLNHHQLIGPLQAPTKTKTQTLKEIADRPTPQELASHGKPK